MMRDEKWGSERFQIPEQQTKIGEKKKEGIGFKQDLKEAGRVKDDK